jgi:hypothetical protein
MDNRKYDFELLGDDECKTFMESYVNNDVQESDKDILLDLVDKMRIRL